MSEFKASYSDNDIKSNVDGGRLPQADTRLRYRIVQALDRQAAALEAIVGLLEKMAAPPMQIPSLTETLTDPGVLSAGGFVADSPIARRPRGKPGKAPESADASELE